MIPEDAVAVQRRFEGEYMFRQPYKPHVNGCSLQTVEFLSREFGELAARHDPDKLCLYVFLESPLPSGLSLPQKFGGYPVVTRLVGPLPDIEEPYEDTTLIELI